MFDIVQLLCRKWWQVEKLRPTHSFAVSQTEQQTDLSKKWPFKLGYGYLQHVEMTNYTNGTFKATFNEPESKGFLFTPANVMEHTHVNLYPAIRIDIKQSYDIYFIWI